MAYLCRICKDSGAYAPSSSGTSHCTACREIARAQFERGSGAAHSGGVAIVGFMISLMILPVAIWLYVVWLNTPNFITGLDNAMLHIIYAIEWIGNYFGLILVFGLILLFGFVIMVVCCGICMEICR